MSGSKELLNEILSILYTVKEDKEKLKLIHEFMVDYILEEPQKHEIPQKYKPLVSKIAEELLADMVCFVNGDTLEIESAPQALIKDPFEYEFTTGDTAEDWDLKHENWENCITVEPMESFESFSIMERFTNEVDDLSFRKKLSKALQRKKPFSNFKYLIESSDYRQQWFDFLQAETEEYVYTVLYPELEQD